MLPLPKIISKWEQFLQALKSEDWYVSLNKVSYHWVAIQTGSGLMAIDRAFKFKFYVNSHSNSNSSSNNNNSNINNNRKNYLCIYKPHLDF
jgi:hypothetical protein